MKEQTSKVKTIGLVKLIELTGLPAHRIDRYCNLNILQDVEKEHRGKRSYRRFTQKHVDFLLSLKHFRDVEGYALKTAVAKAGEKQK